MVSDFRKKKITHLYKVVFDCEVTEPITEGDFKTMIGNISDGKGWMVGDEAYKQAEKAMYEVWEGMQAVADNNMNGEISLDEWISMWDNVFKDPSDADSFQAYYCKTIFFLQDASADSVIDQDEFVNMHHSLGIPKEEAEQAFQKAANGQPTISWGEFQKRWEEYFTSEDEDAPGNYIFGNLNF